MSGVNRSKAKGTSWESECAAYLRANGVPWAERRALGGALDKGDLAGVPEVAFECKAEQSIDLPGYLREAEAERANSGARIGVVWIKRRGKTAAEHGYIVMTPEALMALLREAGIVRTAA